MARSASQRWSKRTKPTPLDSPAERDTFELETSDFSMWSGGGGDNGSDCACRDEAKQRHGRKVIELVRMKKE